MWKLFGFKKKASPPVHVIQHDNLEAAIWKNRSIGGKVYYSVTFSHLWEDGRRWKSLLLDDIMSLPVLAESVAEWCAINLGLSKSWRRRLVVFAFRIQDPGEVDGLLDALDREKECNQDSVFR